MYKNDNHDKGKNIFLRGGKSSIQFQRPCFKPRSRRTEFCLQKSMDHLDDSDEIYIKSVMSASSL